MKHKLVIVSILKRVNLIIGFKGYDLSTNEIKDIPISDINNYIIVGLKGGKLDKKCINNICFNTGRAILNKDVNYFIGYRSLPIYDMALNSIDNYTHILIGKKKVLGDYCYVVSDPFGCLEDVEKDIIIGRMQNRNYNISNIAKINNSQKSIRLLYGTLPIINVNKGAKEMGKIKTLFEEYRLDDIRVIFNKSHSLNLKLKEIEKVKLYKSSIINKNYIDRQQFLFNDVSNTFPKNDRNNMRAILKSIEDLDSKMPSIIQLGVTDKGVIENLNLKQSMHETSNFINKELIKYEIHRRANISCINYYCDKIFKKIDGETFEKCYMILIKLFRKSQNNVFCNNCDILIYLRGSLYSYNKKTRGNYNIKSNGYTFIDIATLKNIKGFKTIIHEYIHYLSQKGDNVGLNNDKNIVAYIKLNEGITEIIACYVLYKYLIADKEKIEQFYITTDKKLTKEYLENYKFLNDLSSLNKEMGIKIPKDINKSAISSYFYNVCLVYKLMEKVGVREIIVSFFNADILSFKNICQEKLGSLKYNELITVLNSTDLTILSESEYQRVIKVLEG